MEVTTNVAPSDAGQAPIAPVTPPAAPANEGPISTREAASALSKRRWEKVKESQTAPAAVAPPSEPELAPEANAAPLEEAPSETPMEVDAPAEPDPIEPPRSWTKEEKERFRALPRETQEYLAERETERDRNFRRSQNEAAEQRKAIDAERDQVSKLRDKYEKEVLPALENMLNEVSAGQFADIRTQADVDRLAAEDPVRYIQFTNHHQKLAAVRAERANAEARQEQEQTHKFSEFARKQDDILKDFVPELADEAKAQKLGNSAITLLKDYGFEEQELGNLWVGKEKISLRDARIQRLVIDGVKYREAQAARKAAVAQPKPPVQRPGVAQPKGAAVQAQVQALSQKLDQTGNAKDAARLIAARRAAARR